MRIYCLLLFILGLGSLSAGAQPAPAILAQGQHGNLVSLAGAAPDASPVIAPHATPARASLPPLLTISDNFDDGSINSGIWTYTTSVGITESNGGLTLNTQTIKWATIQTQSELLANGRDILVTVDFSEVVTSDSSLTALTLSDNLRSARIVMGRGNSKLKVYFEANNNAGGYINNSGNPFNTSAEAGRLRLWYHDATGAIEGLVEVGGGWTSLGSIGKMALEPGKGFKASLSVSAPDQGLISVKYDNFYAEGSQFVPLQLGDAGLFERVTYNSGSDSRDFRMKVPRNYQPDRPIGIVFGFHGYLGETPMNQPPLSYLLDARFEEKVETGYFLTASLAVRKSADGWKGGWNQNTSLASNHDARAVQDAITYLKRYYAIDDNRIFVTGFSNGGYFCTTLPHCLPGVLAASAPICPAPTAQTPPAGMHVPNVGVGGVTDPYNTDDTVRNLLAWHRNNNVEADYYIYDMGHTFPPDNYTTSPAREWIDTLTEFFIMHPRNFGTAPITPPSEASLFHDDFDGPGQVLDGTRWTTQLFDSNGMLYGPMNASGQPGNSVFGYKLSFRNGSLCSSPIGSGNQGGLCLTRFISGKVVWRTFFTADAVGSDLVIWPAIVADTTGKMAALKIRPSGWSWEVASTPLAFRAAITANTRVLSSGALTLAAGKEYQLRLITGGSDASTWQLLDGQVTVASGSIPDTTLAGALQFGLGLSGTNASVSFSRAWLDGPPNAVAPGAWGRYQ